MNFFIPGSAAIIGGSVTAAVIIIAVLGIAVGLAVALKYTKRKTGHSVIDGLRLVQTYNLSLPVESNDSVSADLCITFIGSSTCMSASAVVIPFRMR